MFVLFCFWELTYWVHPVFQRSSELPFLSLSSLWVIYSIPTFCCDWDTYHHQLPAAWCDYGSKSYIIIIKVWDCIINVSILGHLLERGLGWGWTVDISRGRFQFETPEHKIWKYLYTCKWTLFSVSLYCTMLLINLCILVHEYYTGCPNMNSWFSV